MRIMIAGASGFIGQHLIHHWKYKHKISTVGRNLNKLNKLFPTIDNINWENLYLHNPQDFDIVINLAGETINQLFWSKKAKNNILQSRVSSTNKLVDWCHSNPNIHFLSASALSIYGLYNSILSSNNIEESTIIKYEDFLCQVAYEWEQPLQELREGNISVTMMRFAVVLGKEGGALPPLMLLAKLGLAAKLGTGMQPFAWIGIKDLMRAIDWIIEKKIEGAVNMVAPTIPTQDEFTRKISQSVNRPYFLRIPEKFIKLFLGQMGKELILKGQQASPKVLLDSGFSFNSETLYEFLYHSNFNS